MDTQPDGAAARIVAATIARIEREGVSGLTVREIAKDAGVNLAALNYYYRSKDILLAEVLRDRLAHVMSDFGRIVDRESAPARDRLREALAYLLDGALDSPHMTRAILELGASDESGGKALHADLVEIAERIRALLGIADPREGQARAAQLVSAVVFPSVLPGFYAGLGSLGLDSPEGRDAFIRAILAPSTPGLLPETGTG
jgi:TetR/AcrR family transcriptional regulator, regulator of cefoperazone and chloramphenicol sensitivity